MSTVREIQEMEERLRQAELGPNPAFFEAAIADGALIDGQELKSRIVEAHRPGSGAPKFTKVEMSDFRIVDHGDAAVVTCQGLYESASGAPTVLKFMRVWHKKDGRWRIIAASFLK